CGRCRSRRLIRNSRWLAFCAISTNSTSRTNSAAATYPSSPACLAGAPRSPRLFVTNRPVLSLPLLLLFQVHLLSLPLPLLFQVHLLFPPPPPPLPLPSPPYNVPPPPPPIAEKEGGEGCGRPRSPSPVTSLSFRGSRVGGDNDDAGPSAVATSDQGRHTVEDDTGSNAALPSLPGNRPEHNDAVVTSGQGWHSVDDDVGPSAAATSVPGNRSEHDDALATSGQGTHNVDGDAGPSAAPP
ncbi:unnamed protein product, partial [Musa acuminata subsp. malaccensis]